MVKGIVADETGAAVRYDELRAINEKLIIAGVQQQELAEVASKRAETALKSGELYRLLASNFPNGMVFLFDQDLRHMLADGRGLAALALFKETVEGKTIWECFPPRVCQQIEMAYRAALAGETIILEIPLYGEKASQKQPERTYQVHALPVRDEEGNILAGMAMAQDVTEQRQAEDIIRWQAHHDVLTGLPNRALLRERLEQVLAMSARSGEFAALLFLDLDRFKHVNDTFGHATGDRLLQAVAARLTESLRAEDTVARLGGDEFVLILPSLQAPQDAVGVAQKIEALLAAPFYMDSAVGPFDTPFPIGGYEMSVTASIGVSLFPFDGNDAESLLRHADAAMYQAKRQQPRN